MKRIVEIDTKAGFCFGVEKAIDVAEENLKEGKKVFGLGDMVHNDNEIGRLVEKGLETIQVSDFSKISSGKVILRAHGEPPETYQKARDNNIEIIDATCPIVHKLQEKIRKIYENLDPGKEQIVIYGKEGHAETIGLMGQTRGTAILINSLADLYKVDQNKSTFLFSQTTMDPEQFYEIEAALQLKTGKNPAARFNSECTICGQMKRRKPDLKKFALSHDIMFFVSGKKSSNGAMLYKFCKEQNPNTYWISSTDEIEASWLEEEGSIGISGATSTPVWQLEEVQQYIHKMI